MKLKVPFYKQTNNDCVLVCVKMVLEFHGKKIGLKKLYKLCDFGKHGCSIVDVIKGLDKIEIKSSHKNLNIKELKRFVDRRKPVICIVNSLFLPWFRVFGFHSVVIIGYKDEEIILIDPLIGERRINAYEFLGAWEVFNNLSLLIE